MADKFVIPLLKKAIQNFVEKSLSLAQMIEFIQYAQEQQDCKKQIEKLVLCAVSKLCGYLVKHPTEAKIVEPALLLHTLEQRARFMKKLKGEDPRTFSGEWEAERSRLLSRVVAECCNAATTCCEESEGDCTGLSFYQFQQLLTHLPAVDSQAALTLLKVCRRLEEIPVANKNQIDNKQNNMIKSFEEKCMSLLAEKWKSDIMGKDEMKNRQLISSLQEISPRILAKLLVRISINYEQDLLLSEEINMINKHEILSEQSKRSRSSCNSGSGKDSTTDLKKKASYDRFISEMDIMYDTYDDGTISEVAY